MTSKLQILAAAGLLSFAAGCRDGADTPDYSHHPDLFPIEDRDPVRVEHPDPWIPGEERLVLDLGYEGQYTERIPLDSDINQFFIFLLPNGALTFDPAESEDSADGLRSFAVVSNGSPFWGGGYFFTWQRYDFTPWTVMAISLRADTQTDSYEDVELFMASRPPTPDGSDPADAPEVSASVMASEFGYLNDGAWHHLRIPVKRFVDQGFDPTQTWAIGYSGGESATEGDKLLIDALYFTRDSLVSLTASPSPLELEEASTSTLAVTANLADGETRPADGPVFTSSDETVATVDSQGLVTAVAEGMARIDVEAEALSTSVLVIVVATGT